MPRGGKRGHKGGRRHFTDPQALKNAKDKEEKEKEWRRARGEIVESTDEEGSDEENDKSSDEDDDGIGFSKPKPKKEESSSEESESSEDEDRKPKGAEGLIEIENPNRVKKTQKKVTALDNPAESGAASSKPQLSRREREEVEKQKAKAHYQKLHAAGKTEEARADLARLAIIKKQREDAAKKREEDKKAKEEAAKAKAPKK